MRRILMLATLVLAGGCGDKPDGEPGPDASDPCAVPEIPYDGVDQDCSGSDLVDADADGFDAAEAGGDDCDDEVATVYPGATEVPYDGIDQDCSGGDLDDVDGDGFVGAEAGGDDCDDTDPTKFPEACGDGVLSDCTRTTEDGLVTVDGTTYQDLQAALDAATDGAAVTICAGTWAGPFVASVALDIVGLEGAAATVLDGDQAGSALTVAPDTTITGLSLIDGRSDSGGGLLLSAPGALAIDACVLSSNTAVHGGGGITVPEDSVVTISATVIEDNVAETGGGLEVGPGSTVDLTGSTVSRNRGVAAGGVWLKSAALVGGVLENNVATGATVQVIGGGGAGGSGDCEITGSEIAGNEANGGAGFAFSEGTLTLTDVSVHGNTNPPQTFGTGGGGWVFQVTLTLAGNTAVFENQAGYGGGINLQEATMTGGLVDSNTAVLGAGGVIMDRSTMTDATVTNNVTTSAQGGGVYMMYESTLSGGTVSGNTAPQGGGVACLYGVLCTIDGTQITDNQASVSGGGLLIEATDLAIANAVILRNTAPQGGGARVIGGATLDAVTCDWGIDGDDNSPDDVGTDAISVGGYGPNATFQCVTESCTPMP